MVGLTRLELVTSRLSGVRSNQLSYRPIYGGDEEIRTPDPLLARQVLSQLSYTPIFNSHKINDYSNEIWWAEVDSNHRPHAYQACALTC